LRDVRSGRPRASVEIYRGSHRWRSNEGGVRRTKWRVVLSLCEEKVAGMYRTGDERSMFGEKMLTPGPGIACTHEQVQCCATVPNAGCATPCPPVQPTLLRRPCSRAPVVGAKVGASASRLLKKPPASRTRRAERRAPDFRILVATPPVKEMRGMGCG